MSGKRQSGATALRVVLLMCVVVALAVAAIAIGSAALGFLNEARGRRSYERDPMFAEEDTVATAPPDLYAEDGEPALGDRSATWEQGARTPVDMTAEELIEAAKGAAQ